MSLMNSALRREGVVKIYKKPLSLNAYSTNRYGILMDPYGTKCLWYQMLMLPDAHATNAYGTECPW